MITHHQNRASRFLLAGLLLMLLAGLIFRPVRADDEADLKAEAVTAMLTWLAEIDQGQYAPSWKEASATFQRTVTSDKWIAALTKGRTPMGECTERKLASALHQNEIPSSAGPLTGDFVVAQFNSSFENLAYAVETVSFEKTADGTWKACGYYVKPRS